jgi:hypothetical protein
MSNLFVALLVVIAVASGSLLIRRMAPWLRGRETLGFGAVAGLVWLAWAGLIGSWLFGPGRVAMVAVGATLGAGLAWQVARWTRWTRWNGWTRWTRCNEWATRADWRVVGWYGGLAGLLGTILARVVEIDAEGMWTSPATNFGDLAFHLSVISSFAFGGNLPPENPIFAGQVFTYPFMIDFLAALFIRMGAGWPIALLAGNMVLMAALVLIVESLGERLTGSLRAGRIGLLLMIGSGGLGFLKFWEDLRGFLAGPAGLKQGLVWFMNHLPATYTINNQLANPGGVGEIPLRYGNLLTTLLIPQRSLLFGLPLVGMIILLWHEGLIRSGEEADHLKARQAMRLAGVLAGLLPLFHAHGFLAVVTVSLPLFLLYRHRSWLDFLVPLVLLASPQAWWLSGTAARGTLFKVHLWWEAGTANPVLFWLANNGIFIITLGIVTGLLWWRRETLAGFHLPFWLWLVIPNVVLLAPWPWDNIKLLVYWGMVSSVVVGLGVARLLESDRRSWRVLGGLLLLSMILSGMIDIWRGLSPVERIPLLTSDEIGIAARIRAVTPPRALILHAAIHNSPVVLSGRRSLMGYPGHLWSHGISYGEREADLRRMLAFTPEAPELLARYGIDYVLIGQPELLGFEANEEAFRERYREVFADPGARLYEIRRLESK